LESPSLWFTWFVQHFNGDGASVEMLERMQQLNSRMPLRKSASPLALPERRWRQSLELPAGTGQASLTDGIDGNWINKILLGIDLPPPRKRE